VLWAAYRSRDSVGLCSPIGGLLLGEFAPCLLFSGLDRSRGVTVDLFKSCLVPAALVFELALHVLVLCLLLEFCGLGP
jgi:hypothetical protein